MIELTSNTDKKATVLVILDGWGYRQQKINNAIAMAKTPVWDSLWQSAPRALVATSGQAVGLPDGQMGNSEVGHMNLGAGRVIYQDFSRINQAIEEGGFARNRVFCEALDKAFKAKGKVHILGLLSEGGVHSHQRQIQALIDAAAQKGVSDIFVHAFLDGRDTPPKSALNSLNEIDEQLSSQGLGKIASVIGRYYAMDRDNNWDRIRQAFDLIVQGKANYQAPTAAKALELAYVRGETDEFVKATAVVDQAGAVEVQAGDVVFFMNFRSDRARQLTQAFIEPEFLGFSRCNLSKISEFVTLTQYFDESSAKVAFGKEPLPQVLSAYLSHLGKTQLHLAETEKYAHVTFFFNGGCEKPYPGEKRVLVDSPKVATYDLKPQMSAEKVTDELTLAIESKAYDFIVCNFANGDMVGHTGNLDAAVMAVEYLDQCFARIIQSLQAVGGQALFTADHGNCEMMRDEQNGQPHTAHTTGPVPLLYAGPKTLSLNPGTLADVAPTLLELMGLEVPKEMTGVSLLV